MATDIEGKNVTSPRIKFRWCRTVPCQTKEIYLILTSLTGAQINLEWKNDLGWYESDLVSLPCGLHSGFLLIREKVRPSFLRPPYSIARLSSTDERDYKVDPFFITPHKYSIELFVQSNRSAGIWRDNPFLRERFLSSHHLETRQGRDSKIVGGEGGSPVSPKRWSSYQELRKTVCWESLDKSDRSRICVSKDAVSESPKKAEEGNLPKSKWASRWSSSGVGLCEEGEGNVLCSLRGTNLRKWSSLGERNNRSSEGNSPDSSYHSRSRSLQIETDPANKYGTNYQAFPIIKQSSKSDGGNELSSTSITRYIKSKESSLLPSRTLLIDIDFTKLKFDTLARAEVVESLLKVSDEEEVAAEEEVVVVKSSGEGRQGSLYFKEVNPPETEGYGCLITFESRSTSMDDLGSPRALEDVLVSLTSSDTEAKPYHHHHHYHHHSSNHVQEVELLSKENNRGDRIRNRGKIVESEDNTFPESDTEISTQSRVEEEVEEEEEEEEELKGFCDRSSDSGKNEIKYPESDITINEDENFQYDSLKNDDQKIPLDIKGVLDSEDSLEYSANVGSKPYEYYQSDSIEIVNRTADKSSANRQILYNLEVDNNNTRDPETSRDSSPVEGERKTITRSYNLLDNKKSRSSANGAVATDSLVLVHPGSLRTETENGSSGTVVGSRKSSETLKESLKSSETSSSKEIQKKEGVTSEVLQHSRDCKTAGLIASSSHSFDAKRQERGTAAKRARRGSSPGKTVLIIRDKRLPLPPKLNSTGTQTTYRDSPPAKMSHLAGNRSLSSSFASKYKERLHYSPLPNKVNGPWTIKYGNERTQRNYPYSDNSNIKKLQKNLYNLAKADKILRKIHPFDYHPTMVHKYSTSDTSSPDVLRAKHRPSKSTRNISFKVCRSASKPSSSQSSSSVPYYKPPVSFPSPLPLSSAPKRYQSLLQKSFSSPTTLKRVPKPYFSIYGKDSSESNGDRTFRNNHYQSYAEFPSYKSSILYQGDSPPIRPAASLPDLRATHHEVIRPSYSQLPRKRSPTRAYSSPPAYERDYDFDKSKVLYAVTPLRSSRRRSLEDRFPLSGSSDGSTDSLIEEAEDATRSYIRGSLVHGRSRVGDETSSRFRWRRTKSSSGYLADAWRPRSPSMMTSPYRFRESSVAGSLRARSETDLRMVGKLAGGRQGEPPYLPYRREQLSLGQVVKVLVPGEGVAMARIVYNPAVDSFSLRGHSSTNQDITVVLISEPTNLAGSVITIPVNKILLAWPKV